MSRQLQTMGVVLLILCGCGPGPGQPIPVSGEVTLEGKAIPNVLVVFSPLEGNGPLASGQADDKGTFQLTTWKPNDGALPGEYRVTVTPAEASSTLQPLDPTKAVSTSGAKSGVVVPTSYTMPNKTPLRVVVPAPGPVQLTLNKDGK